MSVFHSEADIARVTSLNDRRELRNFQRFLRLWPQYGFDMLARSRWQKYLGINVLEASALQSNPPFRRMDGHGPGVTRP